MSQRTFELHENSGADGVVHLAIPTNQPDCRYRVVVSIEAEQVAGDGTMEKSWPPGVFESIAGQWEGEFDRGIV